MHYERLVEPIPPPLPFDVWQKYRSEIFLTIHFGINLEDVVMYRYTFPSFFNTVTIAHGLTLTM